MVSRHQVSRVRIFGIMLAAAVIAVSLAAGAAADVSTPIIASSTPSSPANNNDPILNGTADPSAVINLYADDPTCSVAVAATGSADAVSGEFHIAATVPDNTTTVFYATATDATPTTSACSGGFTYVEDSFSPTPSIDSSDPPPPANNNNPTLNGTAEAGSKVRVFTNSQCQPPSAETGTADGLGHFQIGVLVASNAPTTFYARATDALENASNCSDGFTYVEDSAAPAPPSIDSSDPSSPANDNDPILEGASEAGSTVRIYADAACGSSVAGTGTADGVGHFAIAVHVADNTTTTFHPTAADVAGNTSSCSAGFTYVEDSINPLVTIDPSSEPPKLTNRTTASFIFSSQTGTSFQCQLDGGGFKVCQSPQPYIGLGDGSHTFEVLAKSSAGNTGPPTKYTWTVDTVAPQTTIASTPPATSGSASAPFTFTSSEPGSTFVCGLDAGGITPCGSPQTYVGLGDGSHTFRVQAVDPAGNADSTPATYSWQIQGVGPESIDHTAPGKVRRLRRAVGYRVLKLTWRKPPDADFDHVRVFMSTSPKSLPRTVVYKGKSTKYMNKRFKNGLYYRFSVVSYDRADNASRGAQAVVPPSVLLRSPRDGRIVHSPPRLLWSAVAKATFYNVQLYYGSSKVLSAWPNKAKVKLVRRWAYAGRSFQLRQGLYHWYVWPAFGLRAKSRYGQLLGQGAFKVR